ncbi:MULTISPECIES: DUF2812 domain-containing protein [unclassified Paenibacillus]|uniref:DUF2812 domain-containing protein n=1 Tax=unclassified Paenibacillus TaxID=185978 RepID=UPI00368BA503
MAKYRMSGGLAMTPESDMNLLKEMSQKGWHVTGMRGFFYRFEKGARHDFDYSLNLEERINPEMMTFYEASGWIPIVAENGYQIFRAEAGSSPIFSDSDSEIELLSRKRQQYGKWSLVFMSLMIVCIIVANQIEWDAFIRTGLMLFMVCFIFTFLPFIGFSKSLYMRKRQQG